MTIQQSSVCLAEHLWFNSQWRKLQALSSTNQEVLEVHLLVGNPKKGGISLTNSTIFAGTKRSC